MEDWKNLRDYLQREISNLERDRKQLVDKHNEEKGTLEREGEDKERTITALRTEVEEAKEAKKTAERGKESAALEAQKAVERESAYVDQWKASNDRHAVTNAQLKNDLKRGGEVNARAKGEIQRLENVIRRLETEQLRRRDEAREGENRMRQNAQDSERRWNQKYQILEGELELALVKVAEVETLLTESRATVNRLETEKTQGETAAPNESPEVDYGESTDEGEPEPHGGEGRYSTTEEKEQHLEEEESTAHDTETSPTMPQTDSKATEEEEGDKVTGEGEVGAAEREEERPTGMDEEEQRNSRGGLKRVITRKTPGGSPNPEAQPKKAKRAPAGKGKGKKQEKK